jgi:RNA polymerase sigma-32 factor
MMAIANGRICWPMTPRVRRQTSWIAHDNVARAELVHEAMRELSDRERLIIRERKLEEDAVTLEALGERLGISKERVRQIEGNALEKLRRALIARVGDPVAAGYVG